MKHLVIEEGHLQRKFCIMFDIKFYARFLAIYRAKMKKEWARIDSEMSGKGMKKAQKNYELRNILK
jgi:hypothetical protein